MIPAAWTPRHDGVPYLVTISRSHTTQHHQVRVVSDLSNVDGATSHERNMWWSQTMLRYAS